MSYSLAELVRKVDGKLNGDPETRIHSLATLQQARSGQLSFYHNSCYQQQLKDTQASAVILAPDAQHLTNQPTIVVDNPYYAYAQIAHLFAYRLAQPQQNIHSTCVIGHNCQIPDSAIIEAHVIIGDEVTIGEHTRIQSNSSIGEGTQIGSNCRLEPNVHVHHHVTIGNDVVIGSGGIIGCDGFGHAWYDDGWYKVPQLGSVIIEDDVDIGANTTIDRGALEDTIIKQGVRLDNQIQVGHNVHIGEYTVIAGCVGIAGSAHIGRYCMIGGGSGIGGHIEIADQVIVTGMSMVTHSLNQPGIYSSGTGIQDNRTWRKNVVRFRHLDQLYRRLKALESKF